GGGIGGAAKNRGVEGTFVKGAIKKALGGKNDSDRSWMRKVGPYGGHDYLFHVRLRSPADSPECKPQPPPPPGDGCGNELDWWFTDAVLHPTPSLVPEKPRPALTMAKLPPACRHVLAAP